MNDGLQYSFQSTMWRHPSPASWYFVTVPGKLSKEIRNSLKWREEGWGRLKATAKIADLVWETAIWYDTQEESYLLPIKAEIRKKGHLETNQPIDVTIWV